MKKQLLILLLLYCAHDVFSQSKIEGRVISVTDNQPLPGVNVIVKGTTHGSTTDAEGKYKINAKEKDVLVFSFIGYAAQEIIVSSQSQMDVQLVEDIATLDEVTIVSTGYEQLPKERATGSFVKVDNELINRRISTDVLSRLEDVTSGLIFNRNVEGKPNDISIRGRSTLFANASPLIVIDNFPYDGDINTINPNDVESITVLKDAAAASIWGARAGNGVIVITTKKGKANQAPQVSFNSNVTEIDKPDLFYVPRMSSSDFVDLEQSLFARGRYSITEASPSKAPLTPGLEAMIANRDGLLSDEALATQLNSYRQQDVRNDYEKYLYRKAVNQQYAISIKGGSATNRYIVSTGWDKNTESLVGNEFSRFTLNANNTWQLLKDKLEVSAGIYYTQSKNQNNNSGPSALSFSSVGQLYPYARLRDDKGNNLSVIHEYREPFTKQAETDGLLNWQFNPLDEIKNSDNRSGMTDYRINANLKYQIIPHLHAEVLYQYWNSASTTRNNHSIDTYFTRNLVNLFTQQDAFGYRTYPVPVGGILDTYERTSSSQNLRAQLSYARTWSNHSVSALGGYEVRELNTGESSFRYYGYDDELASNVPVDYTSFFPSYNNPQNFGTVPNADYLRSLTDRFISYYGNAAYTFKNKYTLSASGRKDQSNLFGVRTNQKGVPLWSMGASWIASEENFYHLSWLPYLKLRTTLGFNGNIDKSLTAYTTAYRLGTYWLTGLPYAVILNPPNDELRWERVRIWNTGIDFESKNRIVSGSVEFYSKWGMDLIGSSPYPPSTGVSEFRGNNSDTRGHGLDVILNTTNINRAIKWNTTFLWSYLTEKVTTYKIKSGGQRYLNSGSGASLVNYPLEGKPLFAIYSLPSAGLDPQTGDPRGYVEGQPSIDYQAILDKATPESIIYHGPARPTTFGSVRNTVSWKNISLSFNISYRLGYYFRRNSVRYNNVLAGLVDHGDYGNRWQKPGDEMFTNVPSMPEAINYNRDAFYQYSSALVEKGDHIRLQDINLTYTLDKQFFQKLPVSKIHLYAYVNNLGILWKATKVNIDPDYPTMKPMRSMAFGVKVDF